MNIDDLVRQVNQLQRQVDGLIKPEVGRWITWTPTIDQGGAVAATVNYARYCVVDNVVNVIARLVVTGAGVAGSAVIISGIPTAVQPVNYVGNAIIGSILIFDSGTTHYHGALYTRLAANTWAGLAHNQSLSIGATPSFALANNDVISLIANYER